MRLFLILGVLVGGYVYVLMHTTDLVLNQAQQLNATYQYVSQNADSIAAGKTLSR
ncbi:MAG TPA: hypothetical protein VLF79_01220 [Candidatus Saccharimonadales bacterium]|nr:hypothetical protein [Candidatus Saccharimonadales bacterium]